MTGIFARYIKILEKNIFTYSLGLVGYSLFGTFRHLLLALILKDLFDSAAAMDFSLLIYSVLRGIGLLFICALLQPLFRYLMEGSVTKSIASYRKEVFYKLENITFEFFQREHSGNIISKLTNDIKVMETGLANSFSLIFYFILCAVLVIVVMFTMDFWLSMIAIATGLVSFFFNAKYARPLRDLGREIQGDLGTLTENLSDMLAGVTIIKTFNLYNRATERFSRSNQRVFAASMKQVKANSQLNSLNELGKMLDLLGCMGIGAYFAIQGKVSVGTIIAIWQLKNPILSILDGMGGLLTNFQTAMAGAERIFSLMDESEEPKVYSHLTSNVNLDSLAAIQMVDIEFGYNQNELVLQNLSLKIEKGSKIALVGPSGQGKSTILKLLLGFYPPAAGDILIEGQSYSGIPLSEIRKKISYVPQNGYLFSGTIMENIRYGQIDATDEQVFRAAKLANADCFINGFEDGYKTYVGERGVQLSGGQRQRILIARAILKDAPILLLDEATSALDSESEYLVNEAIGRLMIGRTTLLIAHRLSTVKDADQILVIDNGYVREKGTHNELLQMTDGVYRKLYEEQYKHLKVS